MFLTSSMTAVLCSSDALIAPSVGEYAQKIGRGVFDGRSRQISPLVMGRVDFFRASIEYEH